MCYLRLDFESFSILGTGNTLEVQLDAAGAAVVLTGGTCLDTFDVRVNTNQRIPTICGQNTGQHSMFETKKQISNKSKLNIRI